VASGYAATSALMVLIARLIAATDFGLVMFAACSSVPTSVETPAKMLFAVRLGPTAAVRLLTARSSCWALDTMSPTSVEAGPLPSRVKTVSSPAPAIVMPVLKTLANAGALPHHEANSFSALEIKLSTAEINPMFFSPFRVMLRWGYWLPMPTRPHLLASST